MSNKLFVGNLSFNTTENDLNDAFAAFGTVTETNLASGILVSPKTIPAWWPEQSL